MKNLRFSILGLHEIKWKRELPKKLPNTGETMPISDHTEDYVPHSEEWF